MLAAHVLGSVGDEEVEDQEQDRQVVRLTDDRQCVRDQVDGRDQVHEPRTQQHLEVQRGSAVAGETPDEARVRRELPDELRHADVTPAAGSVQHEIGLLIDGEPILAEPPGRPEVGHFDLTIEHLFC